VYINFNIQMSDLSATNGVVGLAALRVEPLSIADVKNIFYINLEARTDRRQNIESQLPRVGFQTFERFNAIKMANTSTNAGRVGCTLSHIKCLEIAKERAYNHLLICEDDVIFLDPALFQKQFNAFLAKGHKWDVVLLAGNNVPPYERIDDTCVAVTRCQTTTSYLVAGHYFDTLLENMREGLQRLLREPARHIDYAVDKYWLRLQQKDNWFLITPLTVVQREDFSDIEGKRTNYMHMMVDLDKPHLFRQGAVPPGPPR
jgi:GR25 family glycosyltransferase involved in LPS biosynthesis